MKILVSDTSILIDLRRASLLTSAFSLPVQFVVPDVLYDQELAHDDGDRLTGNGLLIEELAGDEVALAFELRGTNRVLSVPDAFALALSISRGWPLLTGDGPMRRIAEESGIDCNGVLWVVDQIAENKLAPNAAIKRGLEDLQAHPRCWLPKVELSKRIKRYGA